MPGNGLLVGCFIFADYTILAASWMPNSHRGGNLLDCLGQGERDRDLAGQCLRLADVNMDERSAEFASGAGELMGFDTTPVDRRSGRTSRGIRMMCCFCWTHPRLRIR